MVIQQWKWTIRLASEKGKRHEVSIHHFHQHHVVSYGPTAVGSVSGELIKHLFLTVNEVLVQ